MDHLSSGALKSIRDQSPLETGGVVALIGMEFQKHVAAGFCIQMIRDETLREVWCERQDDITLIWANPVADDSDSELVEFVQVKSNQPNQLWTPAMLRERNAAGTSIFERLLANDRSAQTSRFRMVTLFPVAQVLRVLTGDWASEAYQISEERRKALEVLEKDFEVNDAAANYRSPKGNDFRYWIRNMRWDYRGSIESVEHKNLATLADLLPFASRDTVTEVYGRLVEKVGAAAVADWRAGEKKITRGELMGWLDRICPGPGSVDRAEIETYFRRLRDETGLLSVRGLKVETGRAHSLPIQEFYIPLSTRSLHRGLEVGREGGGGGTEVPRRLKSAPRGEVAGFGAGKAVPLEEALREPRLLIQGEAGSGKSTFLKRIAWELASPGGAQMLTLPEQFRDVFPIFIRIADLEQHVTQCLERKEANGAPTIREHSGWLAHFLHRTQGLPESYFLARLQEPKTLVMLDGLDEAPTENRRRQVCAVIEKAAREFRNARFVVTTRPGSGISPAGFDFCRIEPLTPQATKTFLHSWNRLLFDGKDSAEARTHRAGLAHALSAKPEIRKMALNPLMLTALAVLYWNDKRLPAQRAELYESILGWLATARNRGNEDSRVSADECLDRLGCLALGMQCAKGGRRTAVEKGEAAGLMHELVPRKNDAIAFLEREEVDSGVIKSSGDAEIRYTHLTFQEYLAARELAGFSDEAQFQSILEGERLYQLEWREVLRLFAGILLVKQGKRKVDGLIGRILREAGKGLRNHARCVALLSAVAKDLEPRRYRISDEGYERMKASIFGLFEDSAENYKIDLPTRVGAAEALGEEHPKLRMPADEEYWVRLPHAGFSMGRFPVTVWEFARFVAETGNEPNDWEEQQAHPSRPVVRVDWNQARAYCEWLSRRSAGAAVVRLPTSKEWGLAAGTEGRVYPWGNKPERIPSLANYDDARIGAPTPVGLFPKGNTPEGLCDMAGNVWEWTASGDRYGKIARGGSFYDVARFLRCSRHYHGYRPYLRDYSLGIRVIRD